MEVVKQFYVKICAGPNLGNTECIYHKKDFDFNFLCKWRWFFEYRAALYRVKHPRHAVTYEIGSYDYILPLDKELKDLRNKIISKKAKITCNKNNLVLAKQHFDHEVKKRAHMLFITDEPEYIYAVEKIAAYEKDIDKKILELQEMEFKFKELQKQIQHDRNTNLPAIR